jgi:phosphatidylinositol alpha-mannosyltransferase
VRVALVSPYDLTVPGGVQSHLAHLAAHLQAGGDEVVIVGPGPDGRIAGPDDVARIGLGPGRGVPFNGSVAPVLLDPRARRRLDGALEAFGPEVVHVHEPLAPLVGPAAATWRGARVVGTFHAWSDADRLYRLARPLARRVAEGLDARLAVSPAARAYHAGALGLPERSFEVVPNGVEVARFATATPDTDLLDPERPLLLFVGRLERRKGLQHLVHAFTALRAERSDVRLAVVGEGPERAAAEAAIPGRLRADAAFLGRVEDERLPGCYAAADLYVSPALGGESFGIVLLEAMAAGAPVVASDIPGYRSVVTDGVDGRLVPPGDAHALAGALRTLLDAPALRRSLASAGRARAAAADWPVVTAAVRMRY